MRSSAMTNINFGLVAVLLGFMVGGAVCEGDGKPGGGRFYQLLAVFLAYSAIVGMHVPLVIEAVGRKQAARTKQGNALRKGETGRGEELKRRVGQQTPVGRQGNATASRRTLPQIPSPDPPKLARRGSSQGQKSRSTSSTRKIPPARTRACIGITSPETPDSCRVVHRFYLIRFLYSFPFTRPSPISGLIYSFALWEAWKMNRRCDSRSPGRFG